MEQDTKLEADSTLPECEKKEVGTPAAQEDDGHDVEPSAEHEDNRKEVVSSAVEEDIKIKEVFPAEQVDDSKEAETPVVQEVINTCDAGNSDEKGSLYKVDDSKPGSKKNSKVLKVKRKVLKKSPAGSLLKTSDPQHELEDAKKGKEVPAAQEAVESLEAGNSTENCRKSESSTKKNSNILKVKRKIVKKSPPFSLLKSKKVQGSLTVKAKRKEKKNKSVLQENGVSEENKVRDAEQLNLKEDVESNVIKEEQTEKSEETDNGQTRISELENSCQEQKNEEKGGPSDKSKNRKNKEDDNLGKVQRKMKKKKNLGGLIFMCNEKTRSDCFYYRVMGVSAGKKDVVLAIKPGLKLFLYDIDLKLLYGIYRASSSGGMKLESKAFHGAFPAQVRFKVFKDCVPLPERSFKKAIKENYYEKHKFKPQLSVLQVRKLSRLFRPVEFPSSAAAFRSPPRARIRDRDRNAHGAVRDVRPRDSNSKGNARNYRLSHEKDRKVSRRVEASRHRERTSRDTYRSEKEYQTYGLPTERRNLDPLPRHALETYVRDYDRDYRHRYPEPRYMDVVSTRTFRADPVYLDGEDYPVHRIDDRRPELSPPRTARYAYDPYLSHEFGAPSVDPYLPPLRRGRARLTYSTRNYNVDTEPVRHVADALPYYDQRRHEKRELDVIPVTSRYSFAGPSYSYR